MSFLDVPYVNLDVQVHTPEEAIRAAGQLLVNEGDVEERYVEKMVDSFHEHGPYIVLSPQIAMPHARPEDGVVRSAVSMIQLLEPIPFGHQSNDPVKLVFGLAASSSESHLTLLQKLSILLGEREHVAKLLSAQSYNDIESVIQEL